MSKKLFVGSLPFKTEDSDLKAFFDEFGEVTEAVVIKDKFSGRSKGFGFVTFADDAAADKAVEEANGKELEGRKLTVNEAKPMEPREPGQRPPRRSFGGDNRRSGGGNYNRNRF